MGETVAVRAHQRVWQQARLGKLLAVQDQIGKHFELPAQLFAFGRTVVSG